MLTFEAHKNLKNVLTGECNRIVIYNDSHVPVAFVVQVNDKAYIASTIGDPGFESLFNALDLNKLNIEQNEKK